MTGDYEMINNKRFTYNYKTDETYTLGLFKDNGKPMYKDEVLNCLNNLNEENIELKQYIRDKTGKEWGMKE